MALLGEVVPDARGRISLGRLIPDLVPGDRFQVTVEGGTIVLTPVVSVPAAQVKGGP